MAGYNPKNSPTTAVMPFPRTTDHISTGAGRGVSVADEERQHRPSSVPSMPPKVESVSRLGANLPDDVAAAGAEGLAQADFARALADHHQHDVHDDDAADASDMATTPTRIAKMPGGGLPVDGEQRFRGEHPEVVTFPGLEPPLDSERHGRIVHRRLIQLWRAQLDDKGTQMFGREPNIFRNTPNGMTANSSCDLPKKDPSSC